MKRFLMNKINYNDSNAYKLCNKFGLDFPVWFSLGLPLSAKLKRGDQTGKVRFFSSSERKIGYIVLLPNVNYKDFFISSLKENLLSLKSVEYNLYYHLQTKYGKIDFWDQIENQFAWSDNNIYDDDFKDRGYQEDLDQFVRYSIIHKDLFHKNKIGDIDMYVKCVYEKLVSKKSSDERYTILVVNKVSGTKIVKNKNLKSLLDINKKRFYSSMSGDFTNKLKYRNNNLSYVFTNLEKIFLIELYQVKI